MSLTDTENGQQSITSRRITLTAVAHLLLSESASWVSLHYTRQTLTHSHSDVIVAFHQSERRELSWGYVDQYNKIIGPSLGETLINNFTAGQRGKVQWADAGKRLSGVMVFEGRWESASGTVGLIVQGGRAWHQHVIIIHLAARTVSTP